MSDNEDYSDSESEQSVQETYKVNFPKTQKIQIINDDDDDDAENSDDDNESDEGIPNEVKFKFQENEEPEQIESDDDADIDADIDEDEDEDDSKIEVLDEEEIKNIDVQTESKKSLTSKKPKKQLIIIDDDEDDDEDEFNENYLEKFDTDLVKNYIDDFHPECFSHNYDEISKLAVVIRNSDGIVIDPLHRTIPYLTKYEKTRVLGQRAKQIETGAKPFVKVPENIIESHIIAELELKEKKIPFIIKRPIPGGGCEYWDLKDLEVISF
jgi:DNA-directed RNA polymerase I, II, and III subunit RPABC2